MYKQKYIETKQKYLTLIGGDGSDTKNIDESYIANLIEDYCIALKCIDTKNCKDEKYERLKLKKK